MNTVLKRILLVVLNLFFLLALVFLVGPYVAIYGGEDPMALLGTVLADLAFIIIGILLILLGRHFPVSIIDKALPFVALAFSLVMFFTSTYTDFNRLVLLTAASIGVLLGICAIYATVRDVVSTGKMPEKYTPQPK